MDKVKTNYDKVMQDIITKFGGKSLLLHACCAPCATYPLMRLSKIFDITLYFYNPNILSSDEYQKRLNEFDKLPFGFKLISENYLPIEFENIAKGLENQKEGGARCAECYNLRLEKAAMFAKQNNFDLFGTVLTVSPYKNSAFINRQGKELENKYGVKFLFSDFKKNDGYKQSCLLSSEFGLYRQSFCGCKYSFDKK